jgi:hypothetical protein
MIGPVEPFGSEHYVPMLRLASAEIAGFADAVRHGADEMTPLFRCEPSFFKEELPGQFTRKGKLKTRPRDATDEEVLNVLRGCASRINAWSVDYEHPRFFLDCAALDNAYRRRTLRGLSNIISRRSRLVPIVSTSEAFDVAAVREIAAHRGSGLALRIAVRNAEGAADLRAAPNLARIAEVLRTVDAAPVNVDAILDLGFVDEAFFASFSPLARYVREVYAVGWRTFTDRVPGRGV